MTRVTSYITLDISGKARAYITIVSKQGDRSTRYIEATIVDGNKPYRFVGDEEVRINIKRADNIKRTFDGEIFDGERGILTFKIPSWALQYPGKDVCDIAVCSDEERFSTPAFYIDVNAAAVFDLDAEHN